MNKVVVIGGGASGLIASIYAKRNDNEVVVLERNDFCGKKILATGNGRCNYFNENQELSNYYSTTNQYLEEIINEKNLNEVLRFFETIGIFPKIKNGYYYPLSNQATSIRNSLVLKARTLGVKFKYNFLVKDVKLVDDKFVISSNSEKIVADKVIVATGSKASSKTGSDGSGYKMLENFGHKIVNVLPSLVQLQGKGNYFKDWNGIRSDAILRLYEDNILIKEEKGEIQLTDYGISGICTFNISGYVARGLSNNKKEVIYIDFLPAFNNFKDLELYLDERENLFSNRNLVEFFDGLVNDKLIKTILKFSNISIDKKYNELTNREKTTLISNLKEFKLEIIDTNSFDKAQVCSGGISLDEINVKTMESKLIKKLYIVGELLDVDGLCGGYNLTFAWISGILAGSDIND